MSEHRISRSGRVTDSHGVPIRVGDDVSLNGDGTMDATVTATDGDTGEVILSVRNAPSQAGPTRLSSDLVTVIMRSAVKPVTVGQTIEPGPGAAETVESAPIGTMFMDQDGDLWKRQGDGVRFLFSRDRCGFGKHEYLPGNGFDRIDNFLKFGSFTVVSVPEQPHRFEVRGIGAGLGLYHVEVTLHTASGARGEWVGARQLPTMYTVGGNERDAVVNAFRILGGMGRIGRTGADAVTVTGITLRAVNADPDARYAPAETTFPELS